MWRPICFLIPIKCSTFTDGKRDQEQFCPEPKQTIVLKTVACQVGFGLQMRKLGQKSMDCTRLFDIGLTHFIATQAGIYVCHIPSLMYFLQEMCPVCLIISTEVLKHGGLSALHDLGHPCVCMVLWTVSQA